MVNTINRLNTLFVYLYLYNYREALSDRPSKYYYYYEKYLRLWISLNIELVDFKMISIIIKKSIKVRFRFTDNFLSFMFSSIYDVSLFKYKFILM